MEVIHDMIDIELERRGMTPDGNPHPENPPPENEESGPPRGKPPRSTLWHRIIRLFTL